MKKNITAIIRTRKFLCGNSTLICLRFIFIYGQAPEYVKTTFMYIPRNLPFVYNIYRRKTNVKLKFTFSHFICEALINSLI